MDFAKIRFFCVGFGAFGLSFMCCKAQLNGFILDDEAYRYESYDRIWKPRVVYVDEGGLIYVPVKNGVKKINLRDLEKMLDKSKKVENLELRIYIHASLKWSEIITLLERMYSYGYKTKLYVLTSKEQTK